MKLRIKCNGSGKTLPDVDGSQTLGEFKIYLSTLFGIDSNFKLLIGYPPRPITTTTTSFQMISTCLKSGDTIVLQTPSSSSSTTTSKKREREETDEPNNLPQSQSTKTKRSRAPENTEVLELITQFPSYDPDVLASLLSTMPRSQVESYLAASQAIETEDVAEQSQPQSQSQPIHNISLTEVQQLSQRYPQVEHSIIKMYHGLFGMEGSEEHFSTIHEPVVITSTTPPTYSISSAGTSSLRLLTWNIWFEPLHMHARMLSIVDTINTLQPDIISFQEVTRESLHYIVNGPNLDLHYNIVPASTHSMAGSPYFVLTMYRKETVKIRNDSFRKFPGSIMGRGLLLTDVALLSNSGSGASSSSTSSNASSNASSNETIWTTIATGHFESYVPNQPGISKERKAQIKFSTKIIHEHIRTHQILGGAIIQGGTCKASFFKRNTNQYLLTCYFFSVTSLLHCSCIAYFSRHELER